MGEKENTKTARPQPKSRPISVQGDQDYIDLMNMLAIRNKSTVAKLVRKALDDIYGAELEDLRERLS